MLKVLPILIAVVAADAFGLSYQRYNKYLFDEIESLNNDVSLSRYRRGANNFQDDTVCCSGDQVNHNMQNKIKETDDQCLSEIKFDDTDEDIESEESKKIAILTQIRICATECTYRKFNLIDGNGKLDREALIEFYTLAEVGEVKWKKAALAGYVDECLSKVATAPIIVVKQCANVALNFATCIMGKFVGGCPADLRVDSHMCNAFRKMFADMNI